MSINILNYAGTQPSLPLDTTGLSGNLESDAKLAIVKKIVAGRLVALSNSGATLADGDPDNGLIPLGFIIQNGSARRWQNKATLSSKKVAYVPLTGGVLIETDQWVDGELFTQGDEVFCGSGMSVGLVTRSSASGQAAGLITLFSSEIDITLNFNGAVGNTYSITITDADIAQTDGVPVMTSGTSDSDILIEITSGTTTQTQFKTLLETHDDIGTVLVNNGATALTITGDSESGNFSGGSDDGKLIGIVEGEADENSPFLRIHVIGSGL